MVVSRWALVVVAGTLFAGCWDRGIEDPKATPKEKEAVGPVSKGPTGVTGPSGKDPEPNTDSVTKCEAAPKAAPAGQACAFDKGSDTLVIHSNIITADTLLQGGKVVIGSDGKILCAACDCDDAGASVLSCPDAVVSPGIINSHDHLKWSNLGPKPHGNERFDHRHDWRKGLRQHTAISSGGSATARESHSLGELRFIMTGGTSTVSSTTGPGFMRNLDDNALEGLSKSPVQYETFPLSDTSGKMIASGCAYGGFMGPRAGFSAYYPHIAEGIDAEAHNEFTCLSSNENGARDVVTGTTAIIHGVGLDLKDAMTMAANGTSLVWSARTNIDLYGYTANVTLMHRVGVNIALGTDWILSGSMNMGREFACVDALNKTQYGGYFSNKTLVDMVTKNAAKAAHFDDVIGTLEVGKVADVAIFAGAAKNYRAVIEGTPASTLLVLRGGVPLYGDAKVLEALGTTDDECEKLDVCTTQKRVCVKRESGKSLAELKAIAAHSYDLFNCDTPPENEPSCVPFRAEANDDIRFTGVSAADDLDGDGVKDSEDSCPSVFNPARPMDTGAGGTLVQPDFDGDGEGDVCDVCPIDPDSETCGTTISDDRDGDGAKDSADNCVSTANADQADADGDGKGDACDACPAAANPGAAGCPATIYEVKTNAALLGKSVRISNVLVTAKGADGFYVAHVSGDSAFTALPNSGLYVYGKLTTKVGDRVSFDGTVDKFGEQMQVKTIQNFSVASSNNTVPAPYDVTISEVAPGGSKVSYDGLLVKVTGPVAVASVNGSRFVVSAGGKSLTVGTQLFTTTPVPTVGTSYVTVSGVLRKYNATFEVSVRSAADLVLDGVTPPPPPPPGSGSPLVIGEILVNPSGADEGFEWVKIYNPSNTDADLSQFEIRFGGTTDYKTGKVTLSGTLPSKKCILVHEGQSAANNGAPTLVAPFPSNFVDALLRNFGGTSAGMQNPDNAPDAVAIFKASVTDIPVDVVTYMDGVAGGSGPTMSGFMGPNGQESPVLVFTDSGNNKSFIRTAMDAWTVSAAGAATPNVCPTFNP